MRPIFGVCFSTHNVSYSIALKISAIIWVSIPGDLIVSDIYAWIILRPSYVERIPITVLIAAGAGSGLALEIGSIAFTLAFPAGSGSMLDLCSACGTSEALSDQRYV